MRSTFRSLVVAMLMSGVIGTATAQDIHIIVVSHGRASDPFRSLVKNGVVKAATEMDVVVDYRAPEPFDMVIMAQLTDAAVN